MQLYAFDSKGELTGARQAFRRTNYHCLECQGIVRLRGGPHRQRHFFHVDPTPFCRQHQKGEIHLQLQSYFLEHLPWGDCQLEYSFSSIGRIADVAWLSQKIVFEIQCSPISAEEVMGRNRDYQQLGWQVVWILHDHRYNQLRLSSAELALRSSPHYFTNMDSSGVGMIYDQFDICEKGLRLKSLSPLPIDIREIISLESIQSSSSPLILFKERMATWSLAFTGDLISSFAKNSTDEYWDQALKMEKLFYASSRSFKWRDVPAKFWEKAITRPYQIFFRFILEKMCR